MTKHSIYAILVMGVSGSGKSTIGEGLAEKIGWPFFDADDFHPETNIKKMASGQPLNDDDRGPWLDRLHSLLSEHIKQEKRLVLAASALTTEYRSRMLAGIADNVLVVYLKGSFELILERMQARQGHFMQPHMLQSQFDTLDEPSPEQALVIDIGDSPEAVIDLIQNALGTI